MQSGLSSGEGVIWAVRDPIIGREKIKVKGRITGMQEYEADPGISDKRLFVFEPEFANVLRQVERQGNVLSAILRQCWETGDLRTMTKNSPARATGALVSIVGHITADELRRYLNATEIGNGFANRFMFFCVRRSKILPFGGHVSDDVLQELRSRLAQVVKFAREVGPVSRDDDANASWAKIYEQLSEGLPGLSGSLLGRAEAHTMRLATMYALLDLSPHIRPIHLAAGLAVWEYCQRSVYYIFGDSLGDPVADDILRLIRSCPHGVTRTDISKFFANNKTASQLSRALGMLLQHKLARREERQTEGRPEERWYAINKT
ncbi:MAG: DUF3987 domain-containing protein [Gemmataceae bacterium]